jgi:DNA-binding PadR family transcriptional regulator
MATANQTRGPAAIPAPFRPTQTPDSNRYGASIGSHQPLGAYEIMERMSTGRPRPAPITVYRALEFLRDNEL